MLWPNVSPAKSSALKRGRADGSLILAEGGLEISVLNLIFGYIPAVYAPKYNFVDLHRAPVGWWFDGVFKGR